MTRCKATAARQGLLNHFSTPPLNAIACPACCLLSFIDFRCSQSPFHLLNGDWGRDRSLGGLIGNTSLSLSVRHLKSTLGSLVCWNSFRTFPVSQTYLMLRFESYLKERAWATMVPRDSNVMSSESGLGTVTLLGQARHFYIAVKLFLHFMGGLPLI